MDKVKWHKDDHGNLQDDQWNPHYIITRHNRNSFDVSYREDHGWQHLGENSSLKAAKKRVERHLEGLGKP